MHDGSQDVAIADWDTLFHAVTHQLRASAQAPLVLEPEAQATLALMRAHVLRCVAALDQLQLTMSHHVARGKALEDAVAASQAALAKTRVRLAHSHANERVARHVASHDGLTALPNGASFRARLAAVAQAATRGIGFAVMYIDLDGFKAVNDSLGHATGDQLLRIVASRLAGEMRADDMVSRLNGDEFGCLLWLDASGRTALTQLAKRMIAAVSAPIQVRELRLSILPSIGIAIWPEDGSSAEALLEHADAAMYRAKRQGCGYAFF